MAYDVPLLFSNTLNVDDGLKGICAPVTLDFADFPEDIQIRDRINSLNANHRRMRIRCSRYRSSPGLF